MGVKSVTREDVLQILQEISDDCKEKTTCRGCKYIVRDEYDGPICAFERDPSNWRIEELAEKREAGE